MTIQDGGTMDYGGSRLSYISPSVELRVSSIEGVGYFARERIEKGETVIVQGGKVLPSNMLDTKPWDHSADHRFQIAFDIFLCPPSPEERYLEGIHLVNHSCDPNCGFGDNLILVAMQTILPGEEVTYDYAMSNVQLENEVFNQIECRCGTRNCRGLVTGHDWSNPSIRERNAEFFQPFIKACFKDGPKGSCPALGLTQGTEGCPLVPCGWSLIHRNLEIQETDRYGLGVFAKASIRPGEVLCVMGGQVAATAVQNHLATASRDYGMDFSDEYSFVPLSPSQIPLMPQFLFNHSCRPNCGFWDSQTMVAIRPIEKGEECRYDYAFCMVNDPRTLCRFEMVCRCGEDDCRGVIRETDWMIERLQFEYGQWFMPFLRKHFQSDGNGSSHY